MPTPTFWLEPTGTARRGLRRYSRSSHADWTCAAGWHEALVWLDELVDVRRDDRGFLLSADAQPRDRPQWPPACGRGCGYQFTADDRWQPWQEPLYRRTDTGEQRVLHPSYAPPEAPTAEPGASWDAIWLHDWCTGADGISLMIRLPRPDNAPGVHDWQVDSPSSTGGEWTRTGDPRQATVTATPSIAAGGPGEPGYYHGFLRDGVLTDHIG